MLIFRLEVFSISRRYLFVFALFLGGGSLCLNVVFRHVKMANAQVEEVLMEVILLILSFILEGLLKKLDFLL